ncbi:MAG: bifunctional demethylmenaquinone methyltransferase/2-methoxy-6-polyprenyl-1,4-benzoquinol methylase UbiE [Actinobacteria bacterium]|nr:bifunctional demethylmenaquinone methyltransferase/2-methoxy-6-polyprenyl-1,4-benzoquinol methylase UbiE [Actinomycetota bacterium]
MEGPIPVTEKEERVKEMFSSAAKRYDLLNSVLSLGLHYSWKRFAVSKTELKEGDTALDVCSGTQDIAIYLTGKVGSKGKVVALDLNEEMLKVGDYKVEKNGLEKQITSVVGNAEDLKFPDNSFDAVTVGFGVRNVAHLEKALSEMRRVLKPGGRFVCLEFSKAQSRFFRKLYDFYSFTLLPNVGKILAKDRIGIYQYLPESIRAFPPQEELKKIMETVGFKDVKYFNLTDGIVAVHVGVK